ncbi:MAG: Tex-like N-terminal domain-containing protein, partial [Marinifilaceae bacterium]|nr:Tex-like N-terminal domain-containing protein [Marinifilaceae bacterium]
MEFYMNPVDFITRKSDFKHHYIQNLLKLLDEGATIPFIARYRKELTGNMDEVQVETVFKLYGQFKELEKRKATILETIDQQNQLTPDLRKQIEDCEEMCQLEDLYLPYKPKRQTRASKARDKGLEPLANWLMRQETGDVSVRGSRFFPKDMEVDEALQGARDIIAERVSEDKRVRENLRRQIDRGAMIVSSVIKGKEVEGEKYKDYFNYREQLRRCPSHRMLAIRRGEKEGFLRVALEIDDENAIKLIERFFVRASNDCASQVILAVKDAYKRLLFPSLESECLLGAKQKADEEAIKVFAENLRQLLLAPPLGNKRVLGIDPGFRTGCKVVCLDETGALLHNETIFPHPPRNEEKAAAAKINTLVNTYRVEAIAIGNGTAGRETERFIQRIRFERNVQVFVVSEDGASVYSASRVAREEFPEYDVTVRGAVSIA